MAVELIDSGLMFTEEDFKTFEQKKSEMYDDLERLKKIWDKKNEVKLPEVKTYERKEYKNEDNEEIKKQVEDEFGGSTESGLADIQTTYDGKINKVNAKINKEENDYAMDTSKIKSEYSAKKSQAKNKAIDQGIARSSIVTAQSEKLDSDMQKELSDRQKQSKLLYDTYGMELTVLESQLENALSSFEIEQAVKIKKRINDLTDSIKKENEKILEYNNKMTELEQKSILAREEAIRRAKEKEELLAEEEKINGYTGAKKENYDSRFSVAKKYYMSLPKERALAELDRDIDMHDYLGLYYSKLRSLLATRR